MKTKCSAELILTLYIHFSLSGNLEKKKLQLHQQMSVSSSVHLSTIQKWGEFINLTFRLSVNQPFNSRPACYQWSHSVNQSNIISSVNQPFKQLQYRSKVSWQSVASLDSQRNSRFSIPARIENQESRIKNKLSTIESRIKSRWTENKRLTHAWFLDNFTKRYSCNTTQHGYTRASNCMLSKRPIQVVKRMFHQGHLYQASFPPVKFQMPSPHANGVY